MKNELKYVLQRLSNEKPLWHWAELFANILPNSPKGTDIDRCSCYRGHFLFIEAKEIGAPMSKTQTKTLEELSKCAQNSVLLVGLARSTDDLFNPIWTPAQWSWIHPGWRDRFDTTIGGTPEFRATILDWHKSIDCLFEKPANDAAFINEHAKTLCV